MVELTGTQFREVTNMKAKPHSQGTLFQGGHTTAGNGKPWPRGFSPERRDEVVQAMDDWPGSKGFPQVHAILGSKHTNGRLGYKSAYWGGEVSEGVNTVARSTVPAEHIRGARYWFNQPEKHMSDAAGLYRPASASDSAASIKVGQGRAGRTTTIHEIGHHASVLTGTPHNSNWRTSVEESPHDHYRDRGQEEGFAENYAETHYRDHRGRPLPELNTYAGKWGEDYRGGEEHSYAFDQGFSDERKKAPSAVRRRAENDAKMNRLPTPIRGQLPLLDKVTEWDHGKEQSPTVRPADLDRPESQMPSFDWKHRSPGRAPLRAPRGVKRVKKS